MRVRLGNRCSSVGDTAHPRRALHPHRLAAADLHMAGHMEFRRADKLQARHRVNRNSHRVQVDQVAGRHRDERRTSDWRVELDAGDLRGDQQ